MNRTSGWRVMTAPSISSTKPIAIDPTSYPESLQDLRKHHADQLIGLISRGNA